MSYPSLSGLTPGNPVVPEPKLESEYKAVLTSLGCSDFRRKRYCSERLRVTVLRDSSRRTFVVVEPVTASLVLKALPRAHKLSVGILG